ncbi:MAG: hypothetical protein J3K34DRAFT_513942 [Monoraphidium minutum]|nr:MAG: hypothetical protein J3K34DRAFT_513942 [Monoraphidium minutum]
MSERGDLAAEPGASAPQLVPYLEECVLLRASARALGLPLPVAATALVYLHRARSSGHPWALSPHDLVCGCLYAAAKAEEAQMSTNQAINATRLLALPESRPLLEALAPLARLLPPPPQAPPSSAPPLGAAAAGAAPGDGPATPGGAEGAAAAAAAISDDGARCVAVGDAYYAAKDALFVGEQHALRHNRFRVHVSHPYKHALHMARALLGGGAPGARRRSSDGGGGGGVAGGAAAAADAGAVARVALCLLHDGLTAAGLGAEDEGAGAAPEALAAAAVVAALELLEGGGPPPGGGCGSAAARGAALVAAAGLPAAEVGRLALALLGVQAQLRHALAGGGAGAVAVVAAASVGAG